ncbi:MAG: hypothetical protein ABF335_13185 [Alphaproteobacteria bacterium]
MATKLVELDFDVLRAEAAQGVPRGDYGAALESVERGHTYIDSYGDNFIVDGFLGWWNFAGSLMTYLNEGFLGLF